MLAGNLTKCELERMQEHLPGRFNPKCEVDGRYSEIQCHGSTGYCWCVNENGEKMPKTEVKGPEPKCGGGKSFRIFLVIFLSLYHIKFLFAEQWTCLLVSRPSNSV